MKNQTFVCFECGNQRPVSRLSEYSLFLADTSSRPAALLALAPDELVCEDCDEAFGEEFGEMVDALGEETFGRSDAERFILSGLDCIDPARLQAYWLSY